jgi:hypothetical protein
VSISITGNGIPLYRLLVMKQGVEFEHRMRELGHKNAKFCKGRSATAIAKAEFGLPRHTKRPTVIAVIEEAIEEARAALQAGDIVDHENERIATAADVLGMKRANEMIFVRERAGATAFEIHENTVFGPDSIAVLVRTAGDGSELWVEQDPEHAGPMRVGAWRYAFAEVRSGSD